MSQYWEITFCWRSHFRKRDLVKRRDRRRGTIRQSIDDPLMNRVCDESSLRVRCKPGQLLLANSAFVKIPNDISVNHPMSTSRANLPLQLTDNDGDETRGAVQRIALLHRLIGCEREGWDETRVKTANVFACDVRPRRERERENTRNNFVGEAGDSMRLLPVIVLSLHLINTTDSWNIADPILFFFRLMAKRVAVLCKIVIPSIYRFSVTKQKLRVISSFLSAVSFIVPIFIKYVIMESYRSKCVRLFVHLYS